MDAATTTHFETEIARQFEAAGTLTQAAAASELRPRARMAGFATLRRARQATPGMP